MPNRGGIIFVHSSNEMYGADKVLVQVLRTLSEEAKSQSIVWLPNDVPVARFSLDAELSRSGFRFEIRTLPILRRKYLSLRYLPRTLTAMVRTARAIVKLSPQTIYLTTSASLPLGILARFLGVKNVVFHCQEVWRGPEAYVLGGLALAVTDCLCISESTRAALKGPVRRRSRLMLNGVPDYERPRVPPTSQEATIRFLIASRWNSWKGHGTLLAAWDSGPSLGELVVVGGPPEMGQAVDVPQIVAEMANRESVVVLGEVEDISMQIDEADFVIVPSDEPEPFGLIAIEAFARGRAVIASDGGGLAEVVCDSETGRLFPHRDVLALRTAMQGLGKSDAMKMGEAARQSYLRTYSIEAFNARFRTFWRDIEPVAGVQ